MLKVFSSFEWLVLGLVIAAAAATVPEFALNFFYYSLSPIQTMWISLHIGRDDIDALFSLAFGLLLISPSPIRAGLAFPKVGRSWQRIVIIVFGGLAISYLFSPELNMPQLRGTDNGYWMWLIGPPAQDLVCGGFLYGIFDQLWPRVISRWLPVRIGVIASASYFSLWHAQNFLSMDAAFVRQQMMYTFAGGIALGLTRQWTGSICFITLMHVGANLSHGTVDYCRSMMRTCSFLTKLN